MSTFNQITLKSLSLLNFKGIKDQTIVINHTTDIYGDNGTGKTTIFDAFTWLMFGKDSEDRKDFELKTLDIHNKVIPKIDHEVKAVIEVNGQETEIKRVLREKWVKQRGELEATFTGNETLYYWNDVPMQAKEFQSKVMSILDETVFKMITNPLAFNSLKWQDRRNVLMQISGEVSDSEIASGKEDFEKLLLSLSNKTIEEYKREVAAKRKKINDDLKEIPVRIAEVSRGIPEAIDFEAVEKQISDKEKEIEAVEVQISDKSAAMQTVLNQKTETQQTVYNLKTELQAIEHNAKTEALGKTKVDTSKVDTLNKMISEKKQTLITYKNGLASVGQQLKNAQESIARTDEKIVAKRTQWTAENAKKLTFNDNDFHCPTCKRDFESGDVEGKKSEMLENFNTEKAQRLLDINSEGKALAELKSSYETEAVDLEKRIDEGNKFISDLSIEIQNLDAEFKTESEALSSNEVPAFEDVYQKLLSENSDYKSKKEQIATLEQSISETPVVDDAELKIKKNQLLSEVVELKSDLSIRDQITRGLARVSELENEEKELAATLMDLEKTQFTIDNFIKLKIETLEGRINSKFKMVKFKLFETQINGGEVECCEALVNGVPFSNVNTASKINAGLDIINSLCEFYQVTAPIFIDNRESVIKLIETKSQIVNLIVSEQDKKLRVA